MDQSDIVDKVVSAFIKEIIIESKTFLNEAYDEGKVLLSTGVKSYLIEKYIKYYQIKTILNGNTPVKFYDVYFGFNIRFISYPNRIVSTESVDTIFRISNFATVIGEAGSGKSTLVKHLFIQSIKDKNKIPILIELRYLTDQKISFNDYILKLLIRTKVTTNQRIIERLLNKGKFSFFLDGFDEVNSTNIEHISKGIYDFSTKYNKNNFMLTSRPGSSAESIPNFCNFTIVPLSRKNGDINNFIDLQLRNQNELAEKIKDSVSEGSLEYIQSFLKNPLLLSLYILTYQSNAEIPDKKYIFYRRVINSLYSEHDSKSKLGYVREKRSNLSQYQFENVLKVFCFLSYFEGKYSFDHDYILDKLTSIKDKGINLNINDFIHDMKISVSLWVEDGGFFSFAHRSLQEYFAASFLKSIELSNKKDVYSKLYINSSKIEYINDKDNFLSLCEEMDSINFYNYYYLPIANDLYLSINKGDTKSKLRFFIVKLYKGVIVSNNRESDFDTVYYMNHNHCLFNYSYICLDYYRSIAKTMTEHLNGNPNNLLTDHVELKNSTNSLGHIEIHFSDFEGLLDEFVEISMKNNGVKEIIRLLKFLESDIDIKNDYVKTSLDRHSDFVNMI